MSSEKDSGRKGSGHSQGYRGRSGQQKENKKRDCFVALLLAMTEKGDDKKSAS